MPKSTKSTLKKFKMAMWNFAGGNDLTLGASISYFTALSLAPLLVILLAIAGLLGHGAQEGLVNEIQQLVGSQAGSAVRMIIQNAREQRSTGLISGAVSLLVLIFTASGVFSQLQTSFNMIWNVPPRPGNALWEYVRKRLLSIGMILALGFLLIVSTAVNAALHLLLGNGGWAWKAFDFVVTLGLFSLLFAMMFKILPDVILGWRDVWQGAVMTAVLFAIGQFGIGKYLGYSSVGSSYGAAGSLVVLLVWVYYASLIVLLGAELTKVYATSLRPVQWSDNPKEKLKGKQTAEGKAERAAKGQQQIKSDRPDKPNRALDEAAHRSDKYKT